MHGCKVKVNKLVLLTLLVLSIVPVDVFSSPIVWINGWPMIKTLSGKLEPPLALFASTEGKYWSNNIYDEVEFAKDAGIHIYSFVIHGPWEYAHRTKDNPENFRREVDRYLEPFLRDSQGCWFPRIHLSRPNKAIWGEWEKQHPGNIIKLSSGGYVYVPSLASEIWWEKSVRSLLKAIEYLEGKYPNRVLGYHIDFWGECNYWGFNKGYDFSEATLQAFRNWLREKYQTEDTLSKAWDRKTTFKEAIVLNGPYHRDVDRITTFIDPKKHRDHLDYCEFFNEFVAKRISQLSKIVKKVIGNDRLTVFFYGYLMQMSGPLTGHWGLEKVLRDDAIDAFAAPMAYNWRHPGGVMPAVSPIDTFSFHKKLWFNEDDLNTFLREGPRRESLGSLQFPSLKMILQSHRRNFGYLLAHNLGTWWMDLWGDGSLRHPKIWEQIRSFKRIYLALSKKIDRKNFVPEVGVFVDTRSMYYLSSRCGMRIGIPLLNNLRNSLYRMGTSTGFYLLKDLASEDFPKLKCYIFLNAWYLNSTAQRAVLRHINRRGVVAIWIWSPPLFDEKGENIGLAKHITGLDFRLNKSSKVIATISLKTINPTHRFDPEIIEYPKDIFGCARYLSPRWESTPVIYVHPDKFTRVLGYYWNHRNWPSFVIRNDPKVRNVNVYIGTIDIPPAIFRGILKANNIHIWVDRPDVIHIGKNILVIHATGNGIRNIYLPQGIKSVTNVFNNVTYRVSNRKLSLELTNGQTVILRMNPE